MSKNKVFCCTLTTVSPQNYIMWYTTWTWVSTTSILPFLTLLALNLIIYRRLKQARAVQVSARLQSGQLQSQVRPHAAE